jgi:tRNA-2-methylthio-N6-dimethylallyladenosine synthase
MGWMNRFFIQTYGCQMNVADSDRMAALLERAGGEAVARPEDADLVLLNTCSVREKPELKVYGRLGELRKLKRQNPDLLLGVCGCQAQREGEEILRNAPWVDLVLGTANVERVADLVREVRATGQRLVALEMPERGTPSWMSPDPHITTDLVDLLPDAGMAARGKLKAFVPVILGCDFGCTFCIVPKTRGPERSRAVADVLGEVRALAQTGTKEVMLLGQTVDAYKAYYHPDDAPGSRVYSLADLIWLLNDVDGIERIRFTSPHPMLMHDELIDAVAECPKACEWIHLPVQSGSDGMLKRMARRYNRARYLERVSRIRAAMPHCAITTDIIVGFPGETDEQFEETLSLVEEVRFDGAYMFAYSPRPGTPAFGWDGEVPHARKIERLNRLIAIQGRISLEKNQEAAGRVFEVLVEGPSEHGEGLYTGYTRENKTCHLPGHPGLVGRTVKVRATRGAQWGVFAEPLEQAGIALPVLA